MSFSIRAGRSELVNLSVWSAVALVVAVDQIAVRWLTGSVAPGGLPSTYVLIALWALATPAILRSAAKWPVRSGPAWIALLRHGSNGVLFVVATNLLIRIPRLWAEAGFGVDDLLVSTAAGVVVYGPYAMLAYGIIVSIGQILATKPEASVSAPVDATTTVRPAPAAPEPAARTDALLLRDGEVQRVVPMEAIEWIEADDNYVKVAAGGRIHRVRLRMSEVEARLDPARFIRVHRSAIVPIRRVRAIVPRIHGDWTVELVGGRDFAVARGRRKALEDGLARIGQG